MADEENLKLTVARTIKWNAIDKVASQVLYALTGIILANMLSTEDFGLVGAILVFQAFASLFVDSGFSFALIQRKSPTDTDYSTVFWFNLAMAVGIYVILYLCAPLIALCYKNDLRLIPLSRVMFLSFIVNATAIVPTNRLMKRMEVKMIAVSNSVGLVAGAVVGIYLAVMGYGAWAPVWQTITLGAVKSAILWWTTSWRPMLIFSWKALRSFFAVGSGMMANSFLNTLFQNIYAFFIGHFAGLGSLGYYTQADKWSKMPIASLSQVLTSSFLPVLSRFQDNLDEFRRVIAKMDRFTAYILFPSSGMLIILATPIFHSLFGTKWDPAIPLFQLLMVRGVFTVMSSLCNNYILALGRAKLLVYTELLRDAVALAAIIATIPYIALTTDGDVVAGLKIFLIGQLVAAAATWWATMVIACRISDMKALAMLGRILPYAALTLPSLAVMALLPAIIADSWTLLVAETVAGAGLYLLINLALRSRIQADVLNYITHRFRRK